MKRKLMMILFMCAALVPAAAQDGKSHILVNKVDGSIDTLLLNNVRDIYHSRLDVNGVEQPDISTLRLRTVDGERVYPLTEIDHVVMPKFGRLISFMGTTQPMTSPAKAPRKTSVDGTFPGTAGDPVVYKWVKGDYIYLSTGDKSENVNLSNGQTTGGFSFKSDSLVADEYIVYYPGTNATAYNKVTIPTEQTQTAANNSDHLGNSGDCGTATAVRQKNSNYSFGLDHKTAVICFMPRVDSLETLVLKHVAVKADKNLAGTFTLSPTGVTLDSGTGSDSITLYTNDFMLPHQKATAQDTVASYMVVAPQSTRTNMKVYYRVYDTKSELDTTIVKTGIWLNTIKGANVYSVTSIIPVRTFLAAYTDSATWAFDEPVSLYGSVNLPVKDVGLIWGYNRNLTFDTMMGDFPLSAQSSLSFSQENALPKVEQKAYYYRAYAKEGGKTYFGKVKKFGMEREIVPMGTSVRWSSINLGAITAEDIGDYYAWGELSTKTDYSQANYTYYDAATKTNQDLGLDISGNPLYDAATAKWRSCWRMPTRAELDELRSKCTWTWTTQEDEDGNEQEGFLVKSKSNADSTLFIPANGHYQGTAHNDVTRAHYWAGTEYTNANANELYFYNSSVQTGTGNSRPKYEGLTIRPVFDSNIETKKGEYLFIRTDGFKYNDSQTEATLYGTMRGLDDVVTGIQQGFVVGTAEDVELESAESVLKVSYEQEAADNGSYNMLLNATDMAKIGLGNTGYIRAYLTYDGKTYYGGAVKMEAMEIATDSTNWQVGMTTARLCGTAKGISASVESQVDLGFVVGTTADVTLETDGHIELVSDDKGNGKFVAVLDDITLQQYYYRAFIRQTSTGQVFYGEPKMLGLEFVDLGLPSGLKWANINVGSQTPMDNGHYYAWGATTPRADKNYSAANDPNNGQNIGTDINGTIYDAAQVNWQGPWRMPTKADVQELLDNCTWKSVTLYGKNGIMLTSKANGKQIFMPFNGWYNNSSYNDASWRFLTWTATRHETDGNQAWYFHNYPNISSMKPNIDYATSRYQGLGIRPVALVNDTLQDNSMIQLTTDGVDWEVGDTEATLHGYLLGLRYNSEATESGFAYATTENVTEATPGVMFLKTNEGEIAKVASGNFTAVVPNVEDGTIYYYRAYVLVGGKYYFAEERQFGRRVVDLGLPSKLLWSNINLGASSPDDSGDYYAWGETTTKNEFNKPETYEDLGTDISGSSHDAAFMAEHWGGLWRMPTRADMQELIDRCTWTEVTKYGQNMYKIVGPSGDSIFIAKRGSMSGTSVSNDGTRASLWTSNLNNTEGVDSENAYGAALNGTSHAIDAVARYLGYAIRPVAKYNNTLDDGTKIYVSTDSTNWQVGLANVRLAGSVATAQEVAGMTRGFVVGYKPDIEVGDANTTDVVADGTFRGTITYAKDTTYYYRAYVKVGEKYYYGNVDGVSDARRYGLELVDLGYGLKWASINIGAQTSSDYGSRYAWGETTTKSSYTQGTYKYYENGYENIGADISATRYDVAKAQWGGTWRMPTLAEMNVLTDEEKFTWTWMTVDGVAGYQVTSKENSNSIFLPAAGYQSTSYYQEAGTGCYYWTSSLYNDSGSYYLHGTSAAKAIDDYLRYYGLAVRPVTTAGSNEGGGGDITGGHQQGGSQQTGGEGSGTGGAGTGNTGGTIGN